MVNYYDENNYIDKYHDDIEPVELVSEEFSEKTITSVLEAVGLVTEKAPKYIGNMERLIFTHGDDNEVYSTAEIRFTEKISNVLMYSDYNKTMGRGNVACRVIAARIEGSEHEAVTSCVAFEKIANKALDGFNIFFFVTDDSVFLGCRVFDKNGMYDCTLSNPIRNQHQFEKVLDEITYIADTEMFTDYYTQIRSLISFDQTNSPSYEEMLIKQRGLRLSYLDDLDAIGDALGVSFSKEKERYYSVFSDEPEENFAELLDSVCESLAFIKSNRVNTYEMLFEADEMIRQAEQAEAENKQMVTVELQENKNNVGILDENVSSLLDDPEEIIKYLKKRRGI